VSSPSGRDLLSPPSAGDLRTPKRRFSALTVRPLPYRSYFSLPHQPDAFMSCAVKFLPGNIRAVVKTTHNLPVIRCLENKPAPFFTAKVEFLFYVHCFHAVTSFMPFASITRRAALIASSSAISHCTASAYSAVQSICTSHFAVWEIFILTRFNSSFTSIVNNLSNH